MLLTQTLKGLDDDDFLVLADADTDAMNVPASGNLSGFDPLPDGEPANSWIGSADEDEVSEVDVENGLFEARDVDPGSDGPVVEDTSPPSKDPAVEEASPDSNDPEVTDGVTGSGSDGLDSVEDDDDDDDSSDDSRGADGDIQEL